MIFPAPGVLLQPRAYSCDYGLVALKELDVDWSGLNCYKWDINSEPDKLNFSMGGDEKRRGLREDVKY